MKRHQRIGTLVLVTTVVACSGVLGVDGNSERVACVKDSDCPDAFETCVKYRCQSANAGGSAPGAAGNDPGSGGWSSGVGGVSSNAGSSIWPGFRGNGGETNASGGTGVTNASGGTSVTNASGGTSVTNASGGTSVTNASGGTTSAGVCSIGEHRCYQTGNAGRAAAWQSCDVSGNWGSAITCAEYCSEHENGCVLLPSCRELSSCSRNFSCCVSRPLPAGTFDRSPLEDEDDTSCNSLHRCPATLGAFHLDAFEVTVGRFRRFVAEYPNSVPRQGDGNNPNNPEDAGWEASWADASLTSSVSMPKDKSELVSALLACGNHTYTEEKSENESLPVNCVNWYLAYAFCAWDAGRLPTEAEWNYAAAGGEGRVFPWSNPPDSTSPVSSEYAIYSAVSASRIAPASVGSTASGEARWGQYDMSGNVAEWVVDAYGGTYPKPTNCLNCANLQWPKTLARIIRGSAYLHGVSALKVSYRTTAAASDALDWVGFRCARSD